MELIIFHKPYINFSDTSIQNSAWVRENGKVRRIKNANKHIYTFKGKCILYWYLDLQRNQHDQVSNLKFRNVRQIHQLIRDLDNQASWWSTFSPLDSSFMPFLESSNNSLSKQKSLHRLSLSYATVPRKTGHLNAFFLSFFEKELQQFRGQPFMDLL